VSFNSPGRSSFVSSIIVLLVSGSHQYTDSISHAQKNLQMQ